MKLRDFIKDKLLILLVNIVSMILLTCYLRLLGNEYSIIFLIILTWTMIVLAVYGAEYYRRNQYFKKIHKLLNELDRRYLIGEVMPDSYKVEDQIYREIICKSNKSVIEKIHELEDSQAEYKEYIEGWVHEVKTPLAYLHLYCENHKSDIDRKVMAELVKVDTYVEMVLYYARLDTVYKDYLIQKISLLEVVTETIAKNKPYLLQNQVQIEVSFDDVLVSSDKKWVGFILNQLIRNAVQYGKVGNVKITLRVQQEKEYVRLIVEDNGMGIKESELERIFDKGFTGSNGRSDHAKSTGIGLYLCKNLCKKLEIGLEAESEEMKYTRISLVFPRTSLYL